MSDPTTPDPRWTPETALLVAQDLSRSWDWEHVSSKARAQMLTYAERALAALAAAGLLVTPELAALREAARQEAESIRTEERVDGVLLADTQAALIAAVAAEARTTGAGT